jgi:glycerol-3-phosphate acyltransferase PlsX
MRIGIDVMGGDHAPDAILKGCVLALEALDPADELVLIGPEALIRHYLHDYSVTDKRLVVLNCSEVIGMDEHPVEAVRGKKDSSIVHMARVGAVKATERYGFRCDAVLSAGNTGACVSAATMHMRRLEHVHRPGIAVTLPTFHGPVVLSDAGANPEPRPTHLWQYGLMAETVARVVHNKKEPRVAVMNIGTEEGKGTDLIRETYNLFKRTPGVNFVGYIEGRELFANYADVVVTDGLVGNVVLKTSEGLAKAIFAGLGHEIINADPELLFRLEPILKDMFKKNDYHEHGGAPLLGVNGICMIAHGSSEARSIRAAIRQCQLYHRTHINQSIIERLAQVAHIAEAPALAAQD